MIKKINYKKILFIGLLITVILLIPHNFAHADVVDTLANVAGQSIIKFFSWILTTLLYIVGYFFHLALFLGGTILNWVLELNSKVVDNPAVQIGWPITRDLTNLVFVFLIIIIAFETILRTGSLQVKQALPKLIIAALIMNFSLLIAAMVLDFAGVLMNFFLNPFNSQSGSGGVAQALSSATQMYKVLQPPALTNNATLTQFGAATVQILANLIFADIITAVGAIVMFGLAVMFLIRYVAIGILLIILPMAIIGWVIGDKEWSKWSDKFFKQAFFGPIAAFYIYIALKSYTAIQKIVDTSNIQKALVDDPSSVVQQMGPNIASMIMVVAILMYGIKKAEDNSGYVGSWTTKAANGAINGILRGTAGTGLSATTRLFTGGKYSAEDLSKKLSNIGKNSKYKLIRGITRPLRQVGTAGKGFQENYGGLSGGLVAATVGGISEGLGFKPLELRKKEESAYKLRQDKIASMAKSWAKNAGIPEIQSAQEVEAYLNKQKDDEKESALDKTKKYFDREGNIKILMKQTGEDKETVKKALADNFDNFNEAKKELLSKKKASAGSAGGGSSTTGGESSTTSRGSNIISGTNENFQKAKEEAKKRGESFG